MSALARDPETGELVGPAFALEAAIADGVDSVFAVAREPLFRVWIEGLERGLTLLGGAEACAVVTERAGGQRALGALDPEQVPVALVAWLGLGPRPRAQGSPVRLTPGALATLIGRGEGPPELRESFERGLRHWSVRFEAGGWRRNLEVVESERGIWRVRPGDDGLVELAPTSTTEVVRELVRLCADAARPSE